MVSLAQLEVDSRESEVRADYFRTENGVTYAGMHVLLDFWGCVNLDQPDLIEEAMRQGARDAGAEILHSHCHHFSPYGGVSGVLVLAESHITIHTWPERAFAALDIFMCGACDPRDAVPALKRALRAERVVASKERRGVLTGEPRL